MTSVKGGCTSSPPRWFDNFEDQVQKISQSFPSRPSCDGGVETQILVPSGGGELKWKLLDDIYPFLPEQIEIRVTEDGKSILLAAKSDQTASDGGKICHKFRKRWAWNEEADAKNLTCYIKDGGVFIEVPHEITNSRSSEVTIVTQKTIAILTIISQNFNDCKKIFDNVSNGSSKTDSKAVSVTKTDPSGKAAQKQAIMKEEEKALDCGERASLEDKKYSDPEPLSKVKAEKGRLIIIKKVNVSVSEHKLKATNQKANKELMKEQKEKVSIMPVRPTDLPIALDGKTDSSLLLVDIDGYLNLFDDNLLPFERQFWENRTRALRQLKEISDNQTLFQTLHWSNIFDDSRILQSNLGEISKAGGLEGDEIAPNELKVVLDVVGVPLENLFIRVSDDRRLIVEVKWSSGFTWRLTRREWTIPQIFSDTDVKCIMSSDEILLIVIKVNVTS